jgi:hypothetical protein
MKDPHAPGASSDLSAEDRMSALFAQLVLQQANMATMLLGKVPHPETGQVYKDIEAARLFIDELEMLENKTKGNLTKEESGLLKQSLMSLRLAFVEAVESPETRPKPSEEKSTGNVSQPSAPDTGASTAASASSEDEHRKKFSKKY